MHHIPNSPIGDGIRLLDWSWSRLSTHSFLREGAGSRLPVNGLRTDFCELRPRQHGVIGTVAAGRRQRVV